MDNSLFAIFITMALVNNLILSKFLGLCPFFGVSKKLSNALSMGGAVILVMVAASLVSWLLYYGILDAYGINYMRTVIFILVIASLVQILELTIRRTNVALYNGLGIYLPLITTNCAVLGVTFIAINQNYNLLETLVGALGAGIGFTLVLATPPLRVSRTSSLQVSKPAGLLLSSSSPAPPEGRAHPRRRRR